jgi:hypothetical protein
VTRDEKIHGARIGDQSRGAILAFIEPNSAAFMHCSI